MNEFYLSPMYGITKINFCYVISSYVCDNVWYRVRPNKKETRKSSYFSTEIESFIKYNLHRYKVHFIFISFDTKLEL